MKRKNKGDWEEGTADQIEDMVACGHSKEHIAKQLRITVTEVERVYGSELSMGASRKVKNVYRSLYEKAMAPEVTGASVEACKFILERLGGWIKKEVKPGADDALGAQMNDVEKRQRLLRLAKKAKMLARTETKPEDEEYGMEVN